MPDRNYWIRQFALAARDSAYSHLQATKEDRATEAGALHAFNAALAVLQSLDCTERELETLIEQRALPVPGVIGDTRGLPPESIVHLGVQFAEPPQMLIGQPVSEQPR